ncbi:MAG: hypothetical protein ACRDXB_13610 [Actinomycetes bacterium]
MTGVRWRHVFGIGATRRGGERRSRPVSPWMFFLLLWLAVTVCAVALQLIEA